MEAKHIVIDARIRRSSTGRYVDRLIEHLQKIDPVNRYTVLVQSDDRWQPKAPNFYRQACKYAQFSLNPLQQIGFASQLYRLRGDLVHFPMNQQPVLYFGRVITSTMDLTMLRFTRPGKTPLPIFWFKMLCYRFLFWFSLKKSKAIITISKYVKSDVEQHYPFTSGRITVTYCASEPALSGQAIQPEAVSKPFIMHVGSPFPHKNIEQLIKAFETLLTETPKLQLVLAGRREYYFEQLQTQIDSSPARDNIVVTGFISDTELKWLYENTEAYALPSLSEGFGLPGLEAMVHGCPVVSSNATCLPEVYGDSAHYFDPNNVEDMSAKISEVLTDGRLRTKLIKNGHEQVKKYSWSRMAEQTLEVYKKVLS